jgi:purine-nucleoside phosphorylase
LIDGALPDLGPVGEVDGDTWRRVLGLGPQEHPVAVVVEGTWWREEHTKRRLGRLDDVRELGVPDLFVGRRASQTVLYACPYGAPRTAEVIHIACRIGVEVAIQIGSCGVIDEDIPPGDVVVAGTASCLDGVSGSYTSAASVAATPQWTRLAADHLRDRGVGVHHGDIVTWPTLFNQPVSTVRAWQRGGYVGVDMETAATFAVAQHFAVARASLLVAWDRVLAGRSFLDPLPEREASAFARADVATFDTALELVRHIG